MTDIPSSSDVPRQGEPTLAAAFGEAVRNMRARALDYRNPHGRASRRMSKQVRQSLAATLEDYARLIEQHANAAAQEDRGASE
jgi:type IV pilus biogenesis protein CpaD/CtpE